MTLFISACERVPVYNFKISVSPSSLLPTLIPPEYTDFEDVFTNPTIEHLSEHSKFDLKIEFQDPSNLPPPCASYNLPPLERAREQKQKGHCSNAKI
jgi:hypothetical protein